MWSDMLTSFFLNILITVFVRGKLLTVVFRRKTNQEKLSFLHCYENLVLKYTRRVVCFQVTLNPPWENDGSCIFYHNTM